MYKVLKSHSQEWNDYIELFETKKSDYYFTSEYYQIVEANGDGIAECFVYIENENIALYPYLKNEIIGYDIEGEYFDIESAYGYGGPITSTEEKGFICRFETAFIEYCKERHIVAEFVRFHSLLGNHTVFSENIEVIENRRIVCLDLSRDTEEIFAQQFKGTNRTRIRKAIKNGLKVEVSEDYGEFKQIYEETMNKVNADSYYYFNDDYYKRISESDNFILLHVLKDGIVVAAGIFIHFNGFFHYHLGGSKRGFLNLAPNNLMMWEAIKIARQSGARLFNLGGGLSNQSDDNLFRFKKGFSKDIETFFIGKRIHDLNIYNQIIEEWEQRNGCQAQLFLHYKY